MKLHPILLGLVFTSMGLLSSLGGNAAPPVVFSKQILPLLKTQCFACHSGANPSSGFSLESRDRILTGGRHGAALTVGKGSTSNLVRYLTGDLQPKMPPGGAVDMDRIALIRRWIDEGARVDSMTMALPAVGTLATSSKSAPTTAFLNQPAPVTAIEYSPDGKQLAIGGYRTVRLLDPTTSELVKSVPGCAGQVQAIAWSADGNLLAAAGGTPGVSGEIVLFDTKTWMPLHKLTDHTEVVYGVAWKPNSHELASASLDKTVRIWDADTGSAVTVLKDHADAVFSVAYSPDGKLLASGSGDRSAKIFNTTTWKRVQTLTAHDDAVTRVAFNKAGTLLATASADKQVRIWKVAPGNMENPVHQQGEGDAINACVFSPDGGLLVWGASNHVVKVFNGDGTSQKRELHEADDWIYSVAVSSDNRTVAAGAQNGKVYFWDVNNGKLLRTATISPSHITVVNAETANGK